MIRKKAVALFLTVYIFLSFNKVTGADELEDKVINEKNEYNEKTINNKDKEIEDLNSKIPMEDNYLNCSDEKEIKRYKDKEKVSDYNLSDYLNELKNSGVEYKLIKKEKDFFDGNKYIVVYNGNRIVVYDYEELSSLKKDIAIIRKDGPIVKGAHLSETKTPKYYTKGEILIIYDGKDDSIIKYLDSNLKKIL